MGWHHCASIRISRCPPHCCSQRTVPAHRSDSNPHHPRSQSSFPNVHKQSNRNQTTDLSAANFTSIFDAASNDSEYKTLTKKDLETHSFDAAFENSGSPDSVMNILREQAQAFGKFRKGDGKLMAWLNPIVNILFTFSGTLGEGIGLVGISVLL